MVTDAQVRRLMTRIRSGDTVAVAASKADMDAQTARKYQRAGGNYPAKSELRTPGVTGRMLTSEYGRKSSKLFG